METANKWNKPVKLRVWDTVLGTNALQFMPTMEEIPQEFKYEGKGETKKWIKITDDWFFSGIRIILCEMKLGIDQKEALRHLRMIQESFIPKHEHKTAAVAYLMSLWFEKFEYDIVERMKIVNEEK